MAAALARIETELDARLGDPERPLLVSVRSGAPVSMPGMMDTVLNLGLNDRTVRGLAAIAGQPRFAYDSYRRFIQMYGDVVLGVDHYHFEDQLEDIKSQSGYQLDTELSTDDLLRLIEAYQGIVREHTGKPFPQDVAEQLWGAIGAVFGSWMTPRAVTYRRLHGISETMGTAVSVQAMVFGNRGDTSATGVAFTRDPSTGAKGYYGEFLVNAQGEDVVAGIRTPQPLTRAMQRATGATLPSLEEVMPATYAELAAVFERLEAHYRDMQDIEFTVQEGRLWILQTRNGKRTTHAALKVAVDMAAEGVIGRDEAILRIEPASLDQLLHPTLDPEAPREVIAKGLPASPGAVSGKVVFNADEAERLGTMGEAVILVRIETSPEDIHGMHAARGILTSRGGMTSHAAVVARGMGKPCVCAAADLAIDYRHQHLTVKGREIAAGEVITLDGSTGTVMLGAVPTVDPKLSGDFATLMSWADEHRRLKVRTNAETPLDARTARRFGAEGIGLCRTEHMFFDDVRLVAMREMILAGDADGRRTALAKILPMQRQDFVELFQIMAGLPVTIRLLDPPLHEFLPHEPEEITALAKASGLDAAKLLRRASELREANPMLGLRGCRLGVLFPEIYEMQSRAIFEAAVAVAAGSGETVVPGDHGAAGRHGARARADQGRDRCGRQGGDGGERHPAELPGRDHDRGAAGRAARRRDRPPRRVLQLRHQRSDPDDARPVARRFGQVHGAVPAARHLRGRPVCDPRHRWRRRFDRARLRARAGRPGGPEARHLRRAWRRSRDHRLLRAGRARLRVLLALPGADRAPGGGAGGPRGRARGGRHRVSAQVTAGVRSTPLEALRTGGKRAMAMALARLEAAAGEPQTLALLDAAYAGARAHVIGLTGPPGVGKSSLVSRLIRAYRLRGRTVGVITIDPSSRKSGGALLGDRARIDADPEDQGVFVRSMAARGRLGGLAALTPAAVVLMRSVYDQVIVETVGVGQSETEVAAVADTVVFCVQPASGDSLQYMKAGIAEIPDIIVVTKADLGAVAHKARSDVAAALQLNAAAHGRLVGADPAAELPGGAGDRRPDRRPRGARGLSRRRRPAPDPARRPGRGLARRRAARGVRAARPGARRAPARRPDDAARPVAVPPVARDRTQAARRGRHRPLRVGSA